MEGEKVLVVGCTGQVALPVARGLARDNEVWGIARFTNAAARDELEAAGVTCHTVDGSKGTGPTWKGMFGKPVELNASLSGGTGNIMADEAYVHESIAKPQATAMFCTKISATNSTTHAKAIVVYCRFR